MTDTDHVRRLGVGFRSRDAPEIRSLTRAKEEILNYGKYRMTTGPPESFNNTVSRIIHRVCAVTDLKYLFLNLRQESLDFVPPK